MISLASIVNLHSMQEDETNLPMDELEEALPNEYEKVKKLYNSFEKSFENTYNATHHQAYLLCKEVIENHNDQIAATNIIEVAKESEQIYLEKRRLEVEGANYRLAALPSAYKLLTQFKNNTPTPTNTTTTT